MSPSRQETIDGWSRRSLHYDALVRRWDLFERLADRLLDLLELDGDEILLDLGAGSGLVSERALQRHPELEVHLVEPAEGMRQLAAARLGDRLCALHPLAAEELTRLEMTADAALSSAAFHLVDEEPALEALAQRLRAGARVAVNYWWHSLINTAHMDPGEEWRGPLTAAARDLGVPLDLPPSPARQPRDLAELARVANRAGFDQQDFEPDKDLAAASFAVEFAATSPTLIDQLFALGPATAQALLDGARERCTGQVEYISSRVLWTRRE